MNAESILKLFELIKDAPEENWEYNKSRLFEILTTYEKQMSEVLIVDGNVITISNLTDIVINTLGKIKKTNSLDEILTYPHVRNKFQKKLSCHFRRN